MLPTMLPSAHGQTRKKKTGVQWTPVFLIAQPRLRSGADATGG